MKKTVVSSAILALLLSGCSTFNDLGHQSNEFTGDYERNDMSQGLAIGAAVGAGAASVVTGGASVIAYSALVGSGVFSSIGLVNDMDSTSTLAKLRQNGITVKNDYKTISISFEEDITFDLQKTRLKSQFMPTLEGVAMVLNKLDGHATFEIVGHADYTGPYALNQYLSTERATVVTEALVSMGVNPKNFIDFKGVGSSQPKDYCIELSCLRNVELIIHKKDILFKF